MKEKTLYEILEVSEKASPEVIEKAYKVLVKKYHPDLQKESDKKNAEVMMKKINEAYEVLQDAQKRMEYDNNLEEKRKEEIEKNLGNYNSENNNYNNLDINYHEQQKVELEKKLREEEIKRRIQMQENLNMEYQNAYENYLRSLGYRIRKSWTKEKIRDLFITILIIVVIFAILWIIPPTNKIIKNFYESNPILKAIIDIIIAIITGIFKGIWEFISNLFK